MSVVLHLCSVVEPLLYFYKRRGTPITKKYIRTALALVFLRKNLSSGVLKLSYAKRNLGVIEQVSQVHERFSTIAYAKLVASTYSLL